MRTYSIVQGASLHARSSKGIYMYIKLIHFAVQQRPIELYKATISPMKYRFFKKDLILKKLAVNSMMLEKEPGRKIGTLFIIL